MGHDWEKDPGLARPKKAPLIPPMRRRRPQPLLVLGFVLVMAALMFAAGLPDPGPGPGLKAAEGRLKVYYQEHPPGNEWRLIEIAARGGEVWVDLGLPRTQAAASEATRAVADSTAMRRRRARLRKARISRYALSAWDIEMRGR